MNSLIQPHAFIAIRLPSDQLNVFRISPNSTISLGKYGSVPANAILGRPYHLTFEVLDQPSGPRLRVVPASELHADALSESVTPAESTEPRELISAGDGVEYELVGEDGEVVMRTNRMTQDDPGRQKLSMEEIETLKKEGGRAGRDLISRLLLSHSALSEKTSFSLAKYTLRKTRKFLKRFTVLPLDVPTLADWIYSDKAASKIMELTGEMIGLIGSFANVHYASLSGIRHIDSTQQTRGGRWLVIDETGGLLVAAMAERMGILHPSEKELPPKKSDAEPESISVEGPDGPPNHRNSSDSVYFQKPNQLPLLPATYNTLTMIHANTQPNLSLLRYFGFDVTDPSATHPLHTHLKTINWLQLLSPSDDPACAEPQAPSEEELSTWKASKKSAYHKRRRRWNRTMSIVNETRAGGFDGLIVASAVNPVTILRQTVPFLSGGANVAIYSPHIEPLTELMDLYSTTRRSAFLNSDPPARVPSEDFPLNPAELLAPTLHTTRARRYQCLPGRTHPLMTARGGGDGYLFQASRVLPLEGGVQARGNFSKKKKGVETAPKAPKQETSDGKRTLDPMESGDEKRVKLESGDDIGAPHTE